MKKTLLISIFIFNIFLLKNSESFSQALVPDSLEVKERYGLRIGIDLSKPIKSLLDENYSGLEIIGDYRIYHNYYLAAEIGNEKINFDAENIETTAKGSYIKIGADYNAYDNWAGMENAIIIGIRYGFSTFSQTLENYTVYTRDTYFPQNIVTEPQESKGLNASWIELVAGLKVEVLHNIYLGANVQLKRIVSQKQPETYENLAIPGFNRTYDESTFGVGFTYTVSYLIPLYKKAKD